MSRKMKSFYLNSVSRYLSFSRRSLLKTTYQIASLAGLLIILTAGNLAAQRFDPCDIIQCSKCTIRGTAYAIDLKKDCAYKDERKWYAHIWNKVGYDKECEKDLIEEIKKQAVAEAATKKEFEAKKAKNLTKNGEKVLDWHFPSGLPSKSGTAEKYTIYNEEGIREYQYNKSAGYVIEYKEDGTVKAKGSVTDKPYRFMPYTRHGEWTENGITNHYIDGKLKKEAEVLLRPRVIPTDIKFNTNSYILTVQADSILSKLASDIIEYNQLYEAKITDIYICSHSHKEGGYDNPLQDKNLFILSLNRGIKTKQFLQNKGVQGVNFHVITPSHRMGKGNHIGANLRVDINFEINKDLERAKGYFSNLSKQYGVEVDTTNEYTGNKIVKNEGLRQNVLANLQRFQAEPNRYEGYRTVPAELWFEAEGGEEENLQEFKNEMIAIMGGDQNLVKQRVFKRQ